MTRFSCQCPPLALTELPVNQLLASSHLVSSAAASPSPPHKPYKLTIYLMCSVCTVHQCSMIRALSHHANGRTTHESNTTGILQRSGRSACHAVFYIPIHPHPHHIIYSYTSPKYTKPNQEKPNRHNTTCKFVQRQKLMQRFVQV